MRTLMAVRSGRLTIVLPRAAAVTAAAGLAVAGAAVIADMPAIVGLTVAVSASVLWCRWLEGHP